MEIAELKLDLIKRIGSLRKDDVERLYPQILSLISHNYVEHDLTPNLKSALDMAIKSSAGGKVLSHQEVMQITKDKYPNLF